MTRLFVVFPPPALSQSHSSSAAASDRYHASSSEMISSLHRHQIKYQVQQCPTFLSTSSFNLNTCTLVHAMVESSTEHESR